MLWLWSSPCGYSDIIIHIYIITDIQKQVVGLLPQSLNIVRVGNKLQMKRSFTCICGSTQNPAIQFLENRVKMYILAQCRLLLFNSQKFIKGKCSTHSVIQRESDTQMQKHAFSLRHIVPIQLTSLPWLTLGKLSLCKRGNVQICIWECIYAVIKRLPVGRLYL